MTRTNRPIDRQIDRYRIETKRQSAKLSPKLNGINWLNLLFIANLPPLPLSVTYHLLARWTRFVWNPKKIVFFSSAIFAQNKSIPISGFIFFVITCAPTCHFHGYLELQIDTSSTLQWIGAQISEWNLKWIIKWMHVEKGEGLRD